VVDLEVLRITTRPEFTTHQILVDLVVVVAGVKLLHIGQGLREHLVKEIQVEAI
jgi:hypothetical protein